MYLLMFEMVVLQEKINHQLIIEMLYVDHLMMMMMVVEKRNLFHQNHFHLLLLLLLLE
jgi:hypothetical protein